MARRTIISVRVEFPALHHWPDIPPDHPMPFLQHPHRHTFHIEACFVVTAPNRQLEFFVQQRELLHAAAALLEPNDSDCVPTFGGRSCEDIAHAIMDVLPTALSVRVMEDGENGAEVIDPARAG